jgi:uncharacterized protein YdhG (YjbR/CyaY superfamily)
MNIQAESPEEYLSKIPQERREAMAKLRKQIKENLPKGFEECMNYGMIGYVVPFSVYPAGYHCDPKLPLPFINIASQKNYIAMYHHGLYGDEALSNWFRNEYPKYSPSKLDMGKSCIRFKKPEHIPYELIAELCRKIDCESYIARYESVVKR